VSHGLDMMCTLFCKDKPDMSRYFVFMEDTSYFLTMGIFQDHNLGVRPVLTDDDGVSVEDLHRQLLEVQESNSKATCEADKRIPLFLYIIPEFHNPTGSCLSDSRRVELVALAAEFDLMVVADEVYQMLDITDYIPRPDTTGFSEGEAMVPEVVAVTKSDEKKGTLPEVPDPLSPLPAPAVRSKKNTLPFRSLSSLNSPHVITIASFSKILAPGVRVGWCEFPSTEWADRYNNLSVAQSSSCICHFASCVVAVLMDVSLKAPLNESLVALDVFNENESTCPLYSHIHNLRVIYGVKYEILTSALLKYSHELLDAISREPAFGSVGRSLKSSTKNVELKYLPSGFRIQGYRTSDRVGGYFLWVKLPGFCAAKASEPVAGTITPAALLEISQSKYNLAFKLGNECAVDASDNGAGHGNIRMCFAK
jgi:DNA-binding transcriptional MocR family regulator